MGSQIGRRSLVYGMESREQKRKIERESGQAAKIEMEMEMEMESFWELGSVKTLGVPLP